MARNRKRAKAARAPPGAGRCRTAAPRPRHGVPRRPGPDRARRARRRARRGTAGARSPGAARLGTDAEAEAEARPSRSSSAKSSSPRQELDPTSAASVGGGRGGRRRRGGAGPAARLAAPATAAARPAHREHHRNRLINFLQGSWRELQRVQWPDRRQVMQATGVVIGFVIVAGVFLGVADLLAEKLVKLILKASKQQRTCSAGTSSTHIQATKTRSSTTSSTASSRSTSSAPCASIVVPTESVSEMKDNQKVMVEKRTMPGYVLVHMDLNEDSWSLVKGTPGRHRVRRSLERAGAADAGRGRPPPAPGAGRAATQPSPVLDRRVGQGDLRSAVGLLRRDLGGQRGRPASSRSWCRSSAARRRSRSVSTRSRRSRFMGPLTRPCGLARGLPKWQRRF